MVSDFAATSVKAWERQVELVVYDPGEVSSAAILEQGGQEFGLRISDLDVDFVVTRSQVYSANVAEFKVYNASEASRKLMGTPGKRIRFSAGYRDMGGPVGIFWGSILKAPSSKSGSDWVTTITAVSSLTEATGTLDIAQADKQKNDKKAGTSKLTPEQKQMLINQAVNRIPLILNYGPDARAKDIIRTIGNQTGLAVNGLEAMPDILFPNGWTYAGGVRGALATLGKMLRASGYSLAAGNTSILVTTLDGTSVTAVSAYLTKDTGLLEVKPTTDMNIPPKLDSKGKRVTMPETYEFKSLLNPKIQPNTVVTFNTDAVKTSALVWEAKFTGTSYGTGEFTVTGKCTAWTGAGDALRRNPT